MKKILFALSLAALTVGIAGTGNAAPFGYGACANNNSQHCRDARNAFAEHHGGVYPEKYYDQWYQGRQGRWSQANNNWRWEGMNGDQYRHGTNGWHWMHHHDRD